MYCSVLKANAMSVHAPNHVTWYPYSLNIVYGATMTIKGSLLSKTPKLKGFSSFENLPQNDGFSFKKE